MLEAMRKKNAKPFFFSGELVLFVLQSYQPQKKTAVWVVLEEVTTY
jgi:hypothetical protein